jgi:hypothetical protein
VSYKDKVQFFLVYISEAHPNRLKGTDMSVPKNIGERVILATKCVSELKLSLPVIIDSMDGVAERAYSGRPDRICVVDIDGKVAYYSERGPKGFKPKEAEAVITKLLTHEGRLSN